MNLASGTRHHSLSRQVLVPLIGACLVAALCVAALSQWLASRQAAEQSRERLQAVADSLAATDFPISDAVLNTLRNLTGFEFIICNEDLRVRRTTLSLDERSAVAAIEQVARPSTPPSALVELVVDGKAFRATSVRRSTSVDSLLVLFEPQEERQRSKQQLAMLPLLTGLMTVLFVGAVAFGLTQRLVRRIAGLEEQVQGIASGRLERIVASGPRDRLFYLAESVNSMADELRSMWRTIRDTERSRLLSQVAGGLAHQLRNAITGIHLAVQLHRRDCPMADQESLVVAENELARTAQYVQQLLHSAAGKNEAARPGVLSAVLDECQSLLGTIATHRCIPLEWQRDRRGEQLSIPDHQLLRSAVMNLVLNALDATGPQDETGKIGGVQVASLEDRGAMLIRVSDSGPGPDPKLAPHLFDPFVTSKPEGLGVGLTVVR